ncbi:MAG TPA: class I SAM-dependent methyltransferase [Gemmataceae bacterium]|jgi:SAM-dependent methyltransferase|nr:class I SAM-dependent methyltransferase [Gemmataceae bacterium]
MNRIWKALHEGGIRRASRVLANYLVDWLHDRRNCVRTGGLVPIETLIERWENCHDYFPTSSATFRYAMAKVRLKTDQEVFLDYGSGMGRVVLMAARYPFRRVIGVEISAVLNEVARKNLDRLAGRRRCDCVELWTSDAARFPVPDDVSVIFLYNPFHGDVLRQVLSNIRTSLDRLPRRIVMIFNNPVHFQKCAAEYDWIVEKHHFCVEHECVIYEAR